MRDELTYIATIEDDAERARSYHNMLVNMVVGGRLFDKPQSIVLATLADLLTAETREARKAGREEPR